jgi:molecular chaperone GrpE
MSDQPQTPPNQPSSGPSGPVGAAAPMSPEEREVAQAANEADALSAARAELAMLQAKSAELADQFLRAKAEAENARRRAEEEISKARKFAVESFADSLLPVATAWKRAWPSRMPPPEQMREGAEATLRQLLAARWSATRCLRSTRPPARSSTRTSTRPSAWCPQSRKPTPS